MHVGGGEGFSSQVCNPVPDIIVTRCEEAAPLAVKGVADDELRCSRHSIWEGLGALGHTSGRGHHAIPVPPDPSRSLLTAALSSRPWSLSPVTVDMHVGPGPLTVRLSVPPLPAVLLFIYI